MSHDDFESGSYTLALQAGKIVEHQLQYNGSAPCPGCGIIINPLEFMTNQGLCNDCTNERNARRVAGKMA